MGIVDIYKNTTIWDLIDLIVVVDSTKIIQVSGIECISIV